MRKTQVKILKKFKREEEEENEAEELKDIFTFKLTSLKWEKQAYKDKLETLNKQKFEYLRELQRRKDEECSIFCSPGSKTKFIGNDRYLILNLTGKGGYSEVYKAYDFELNKFVACKVHKFDNQWSELQKMTYMRYAVRETEIHQDLNHPRIVKHYNTIELD